MCVFSAGVSEAIRQLLLRVADEKQLPFTWRRVGLPQRITRWALMSLQHRLVKTGGQLVKHARYYWLLLAEGHLHRRRLFSDILVSAVTRKPARVSIRRKVRREYDFS